MVEYFKKGVELIRSTQVPEQLKNVDYSGLFHNPWFIVPAALIVVYLIYKKEFNFLVIGAVVTGIWLFTGTDYMSSLVVGGEIQIGKILPVVFGGAMALIIIVYLLLNRD